MMQIYAKKDGYQVSDNYDLVAPDDFNKLHTSLTHLYPGCTVHFVEDRKPKWPFIVGKLYEQPVVKGKGKQKVK